MESRGSCRKGVAWPVLATGGGKQIHYAKPKNIMDYAVCAGRWVTAARAYQLLRYPPITLTS